VGFSQILLVSGALTSLLHWCFISSRLELCSCDAVWVSFMENFSKRLCQNQFEACVSLLLTGYFVDFDCSLPICLREITAFYHRAKGNKTELIAVCRNSRRYQPHSCIQHIYYGLDYWLNLFVVQKQNPAFGATCFPILDPVLCLSFLYFFYLPLAKRSG